MIRVRQEAVKQWRWRHQREIMLKKQWVEIGKTTTLHVQHTATTQTNFKKWTGWTGQFSKIPNTCIQLNQKRLLW